MTAEEKVEYGMAHDAYEAMKDAIRLERIDYKKLEAASRVMGALNVTVELKAAFFLEANHRQQLVAEERSQREALRN